ncbi:MAG: DUF177 domain-containing protein [Bacteroidota bacterium]
MKQEAYSINLKALKEGLSNREYTIDTNFFSRFDGSSIKDGQFGVKLEIDKKPKVINLDFSFSGTFKTECDRCLQEIDLPMEGEAKFLLKYSSKNGEDDNVIFITRDQQELDLSKFLFEMIHLVIPMRKVKAECDEEPTACDNSILDYISDEEQGTEEEEQKGTLWEQMQKLKGL